MHGGHTWLLVRKAALPALAVLIIANFLGYAIAGSNGVLSLGDYRRLKAEKTSELVQLRQERGRLAHRAHGHGAQAAPAPGEAGPARWSFPPSAGGNRRAKEHRWSRRSHSPKSWR